VERLAKTIKSSMIATLSIILLFSCKNDIKNVIKVSELEKLPELLGEDIHFTQAEYGKIVIAISTPSIIKKKTDDEAEESIMEFPQGISVVQFSRESDTLTMISANYAINYEDKNIWEARGNVVGRNKKDGETIRTEYLVWNQKDGTIYSDKKVHVTTPDDIIYGEGFKSDDQFNDWQVKKVTGVISFEGENLPKNEEE
jgi:LPS export ABC transporter protein LptC